MEITARNIQSLRIERTSSEKIVISTLMKADAMGNCGWRSICTLRNDDLLKVRVNQGSGMSTEAWKAVKECTDAEIASALKQ